MRLGWWGGGYHWRYWRNWWSDTSENWARWRRGMQAICRHVSQYAAVWDVDDRRGDVLYMCAWVSVCKWLLLEVSRSLSYQSGEWCCYGWIWRSPEKKTIRRRRWRLWWWRMRRRRRMWGNGMWPWDWWRLWNWGTWRIWNWMLR